MAVTSAPRLTEEVAAKVALEGSFAQRTVLAAHALRTLLRDPDDTHQVFLLGLLANRPLFPRFFTRFANDADGAALLQERPSIDSRSTDFAALRALPAGTLGREYMRYLDDNELDPDLFQAPPGLPLMMTYVAQRMRQSHDIWHVLTGYAPDVPGEVALQGFTFAQTGMPSAGLIAAAGSLKFGFKHRELWAMTLEGYRRGRASVFLPTVRWERLWEKSVDEVRALLHIPPRATA